MESILLVNVFFLLSVVTASTYALFAIESNAEVNVVSGNIDIAAKFNSIKTNVDEGGNAQINDVYTLNDAGSVTVNSGTELSIVDMAA